MQQNQTVLVMALLRVISGLMELGAAYLVFRLNSIESALQVNGFLAVAGHTILLAGVTLGICGLSGRIPLGRLLLVYLGALLIFLGTRH